MKFAAAYRFSRLAALMSAALAVLSSVAIAADPWADVRPRPNDFLGTLSCTSASCHGGAETYGPTGLVAHQEYVRWMGTEAKYADGRRGYDPRARLESSKTDPHSLAAWRIGQPRFQEVLRKASLRADGSTDANMYQRCAACHDPLGSATKSQISTRRAHDTSVNTLDSCDPQHSKAHAPGHAQEAMVTWDGPITMVGISCESCHGGGRQWISAHYQRDVSREWLAEHGMIDTKNLLVRSRQCAACHVGSADQDMNHDMIAAGHPPLRFEQASYEALLAGKHWNDAPKRTVDPNYEIQLWAAGRIAAADAALALLEGRAQRAESQEPGVRGHGPWPEFAESNCFACHQPMRSMEGRPTERPVAASRLSGVAEWQTWNLALMKSIVAEKPAGEGGLPPARFSEAIGQLRAAMEQTFEPAPAKIASLAAAARAALREVVRVDSRGQVLDRHGRPLDVDTVLNADAPAWNSTSWDEACHRVAVLAAADRSLRDARAFGSLQPRTPSDWRERMGRAARSLRFTRPDREWPAALNGFRADEKSMPGVLSMEKIGPELEILRRELINKSLDASGRGP